MEPQLKFSFRIDIRVSQPVVVSNDKKYGKRQLIPIVEGKVHGDINGKVLSGGIDSQHIQPDGLCNLSARYAILTDEGESFYIENNGIRRIPEPYRAKLFGDDMSFFDEIDQENIYFKAVPSFEVYSDNLRWLNESIFICSAQRTSSGVFLDFYQVC